MSLIRSIPPQNVQSYSYSELSLNVGKAFRCKLPQNPPHIAIKLSVAEAVWSCGAGAKRLRSRRLVSKEAGGG